MLSHDRPTPAAISPAPPTFMVAPQAHDNSFAKEKLVEHMSCEPDRPELVEGTHYVRFTGSPFVQGGSDPAAISMNDVNQGQLGDCYLLAACAAVADRSPEVIEGMVQSWGGGCYEVTLHMPTTEGPKERAPVKVFIDDFFPAKSSAEPAHAGAGDATAAGRELWPMLIEKAYAKVHASYEAIGQGGIPEGTLEALTGKDAKWMLALDPRLPSLVQVGLAMNRPIVAASTVEWLTDQKRAEELSIVANHAYAVKSATDRQIELYNPWGHAHLTLVWAEFRKFFALVYYGST